MAQAKCCDCGADFEARWKKQLRCATCQRAHNLESMRASAKRIKDENRRVYYYICRDCGAQSKAFSRRSFRCQPCQERYNQMQKNEALRQARATGAGVYVSDGFLPVKGIPVEDYNDWPKGNVIAYNREELEAGMAMGCYPPGLIFHRAGGMGKRHVMSGVYGERNRIIDD